ncbi:MAG TPA: methyltransferase domain-containing protein [Gammaproteobacteria bacterium]|nr:methyltransferase domain-containing protein [Gammaproteobacteria bacterium]
MTDTMSPSSHAAFDLSGRRAKAEKIRRLIPLPGTGDMVLRLLEVGTGSGAIAHYFSGLAAPSFDVEAIDVRDQRRIYEGYRFRLYDGQHLPFEDAAFDIVISNHVIEHVGDRVQQADHLSELGRVLAPGGYVYVATPSRWQIVEPHFALPLLSWIPRRWQDGYVRITGKGERYDCDLLRPTELRRLLDAGGLPYRNLNVQALREFVTLERHRSLFARLVAVLPGWLLQLLHDLSPTLIYLIHRPNSPASDSHDRAQARVSSEGYRS